MHFASPSPLPSGYAPPSATPPINPTSRWVNRCHLCQTSMGCCRNSRYRSHFGSRYKLGCCGHAGLFFLAASAAELCQERCSAIQTAVPSFSHRVLCIQVTLHLQHRSLDMIAVGSMPFRNGALSRRIQLLDQTVLSTRVNHLVLLACMMNTDQEPVVV